MSEPILLRVTQVLQLAGLLPDKRFMDEYSRERGKAVHLAIRYFDEADLDEETVDPEIKGYVKAYVNWRDGKNGLRYSAIEKRLENLEEGIGGTVDRIVESEPPTIVDFKTGEGSIPAPVGLQMAGYGWLYDPKEAFARLGVKLHRDGTFAERRFPLEEYENDVQVFKGALCLAKWKLSHSR